MSFRGLWEIDCYSVYAGTGNRGQVSKLVNSLRTFSPDSPTSSRFTRLVYRLRLSIPGTRYKNIVSKYLRIYFTIFVRVPGIEPGSSDWQPDVLPLNHTR